MATRYYPAVAVPNVEIHGGAQGSWDDRAAGFLSWNPVQPTWRLLQTKVDAGQQTQRALRINQAPYDMLLYRWMTPPLEAQSISGTINLCFQVQCRWEDSGSGFTNDATAVYKLHVYLAQGQTTTVRATLLDNYIDPTNFPGTTGEVWRSLNAAQSLAAAAAQAGDVIVIELGCQLETIPVHTVAYPPDDWALITFRASGANNAFADAVAGDTSTSRAPWFEFSMNLTEQAAPAPPANDACADAITIPSLPYTSDFIDTTGSTDTNKRVWWTWTAPSTGVAIFHTLGCNYYAEVRVFEGGCGALVGVSVFIENYSNFLAPRAIGRFIFEAQAGTQYWIRLEQVTATADGNNAPNHGGLGRISGVYRSDPQVDDLYLPAGAITQVRDGLVINLETKFVSNAPTGVAIDYTGRPMDDLNGGINTSQRLLVGLFDSDLVEILDLLTLNAGEFEVDFIDDPWNVPPGINEHPAQLYVTAAGFLYAAWFGNGFLYVAGEGTLPVILNTVSNDASYSALKSIDATDGDNQPGAPFTDAEQVLAIEITAPWAITLDETTGVLYYTSGGFYIPVGGQVIGRYNVNSSTQLPDFATVALQPGRNPGIKGLRFLPGGGVLVCNSTVVERYDSDGVLVGTYTPSVSEDSQTLVDVQLTADGTQFWVVDLLTTRLFLVDIVTMLEVATYQPYLMAEALVQMAIYQPNGAEPPPGFCPGIRSSTPRTDGLPYSPFVPPS